MSGAQAMVGPRTVHVTAQPGPASRSRGLTLNGMKPVILCGRTLRMLRWCAVVLWAGVIFTLSSIPSLQSPFVLRKLAHMGVYAVLTVLLFLALRKHTKNTPQALWLAALLAAIYAWSDEWHQTFVTGRHGSFRDVGIDMLGIVVSLVVVHLTRFKLLVQKA